MNNGLTGYAGASPRYSGQNAPAAALAPKEVEIGLLESLRGALNIGHDRVSRLESLAVRIFGEEPPNASIAPEPIVIGDALLVTARNLVERLNDVLTRLERIA
jgi:hypothetical protein